MKKVKKAEKRDRAQRRKVLAIGIAKAWESLNSHLGDSVKCRKDQGDHENEEWNARCVLDYATIIYGQARELHELAKIDFPMTCSSKKFMP